VASSARRGRGEGSIHQRHDHPTCPPLIDGERARHRCRGTWVAVIDNGTVNGKRDRRNIYGKTKTEVQDKRADAVRRAKGVRPSSLPTVGAWLDEWVETYKTDVRDQSRETYRKKIDAYLIPLIGNTRLDRLTTLQIEQLETRLRMPCPDPTPAGKCPHKPSHGLSYATARLVYTILKDALNDAVKARKIVESPGDGASGPSKKRVAGVTPPKPELRLSTTVADAVLAVAETQGDAARWYCALEMGLRQGEARALPWSLVDLERGLLSVQASLDEYDRLGPPKSDAGYRTIPILPGTLAALKRRRANILAAGGTIDPAARIFEVSANADRAAWSRLLKSAGVPHVKLHSARQTSAHRFRERDVPAIAAAEFFGWENIEMVYHYQRDAEVEELRKAIAG
jgi:integrase